MAAYARIDLAEMDEFLGQFAPAGFVFVRVTPPGCNEVVYDCPFPFDSTAKIRIYTSIDPTTGVGRGVGADAIRVTVLHTRDDRPLLQRQQRVHRVAGWRANLRARLRSITVARLERVRAWRGNPVA